MKRALCVGINTYPNPANNLSGCINDMNDWAELLISAGFVVTRLANEQATPYKILDVLSAMTRNMGEGDECVFTYSGHGTQVPDRNGDEPDGYDEALYVHGGVITDDELRSVLDYLRPGVKMHVILDSCFSGTSTRLVQELGDEPVSMDEYAKAKFVPPSEEPAELGMRVTKILSEGDMPELLLSGCSDIESSYDAFIDQRYNGAMTRFAIDTINEKPDATWQVFYARLLTKLPTRRYPQTPQLEGKVAEKESCLFTAPECGNELPQDPPVEPPVKPPSCLTALLNLLRKNNRIKPL